MAAAMDVLGCLPGPPTKHNIGAADALAGEVFAYGVAAAIAVLDVRVGGAEHEAATSSQHQRLQPHFCSA